MCLCICRSIRVQASPSGFLLVFGKFCPTSCWLLGSSVFLIRRYNCGLVRKHAGHQRSHGLEFDTCGVQRWWRVPLLDCKSLRRVLVQHKVLIKPRDVTRSEDIWLLGGWGFASKSLCVIRVCAKWAELYNKCELFEDTFCAGVKIYNCMVGPTLKR